MTEAPKAQGRSPAENIVGVSRPLGIAGVEHLRDDVRAVRIERSQQLWILLGRREDVAGQRAVVVPQVGLHTRIEVRPLVERLHRSRSRAWKWEGARIQPMQAELGLQH